MPNKRAFVLLLGCFLVTARLSAQELDSLDTELHERTLFDLQDSQEELTNRFNEACKLHNQGKYVEALEILDSIPIGKIDDPAAVYTMKAACYYALGMPRKALEQTALAEQNDPDKDQKSTLAMTKGRALRDIGEFDAAGATLPSDSADKATLSDRVKFLFSFSPVFDTNPLFVGKESSANVGGKKFKPRDWGLQTNFGMNIYPWRNDHVGVSLQAGLSYLWYDKNKELDSISIPIVAAVAIRSTDRLTITPAVGTTITYLNNDLFQVEHGPGVKGVYAWSDLTSTTAGVQLTLRTTANSLVPATPELDREGTIMSYFADHRIGFLFLNSAWHVGAKFGLTREETRGSEYDANWWSSSAYLESGKIGRAFKFSATFGRNQGDYLHKSIYTDFTQTNHSTIYSADFKVDSDILKPFVLQIGYTFTNALSNINVFDYTRGFWYVGLTLDIF